MILISFVVLACAATAGVYARRPSYESDASLLVNVERFNVSSSRADARQDVAVLTAVEAVTSLAEAFRSRELIEQVVDRIDPHVFDSPASKNPIVRLLSTLSNGIVDGSKWILRSLALLPPEDLHYELVKRIEEGLEVSTVRQTQVVRLSFRASNPVAAQVVLKSLVDAQIQRTMQRMLTNDEAPLLAAEAERLKGELERTETRIYELRSKYRIADLSAEKSSITERLSKLIIGAEGASNPSEARVAALLPSANTPATVGEPYAQAAPHMTGDAAPGDGTSGASTGQIAQLRSQINTLKVQRSGLLARFSPDVAQVKALEMQIAEAEQLLQKEVALLVDTVNGYRSRLDTLLFVEPELANLARSASILNSSFEIYRKAAEDRRIMRQQQANVQIQVIDQASMPYRARGPEQAVLFGAGVAFSLVLAIGFALLLGYFERDAATRRDLTPPA